MNTKRKFTVEELKDVTGWQGPLKNLRLYPQSIVIVDDGRVEDTSFTLNECRSNGFTPLTGQPLIDAIRALGYEVEEGKPEQRYTAREWLEKTMPQGGEWRTLSANSDYLWWHHCPDSNGVYFYAGAMRASCDPLAGHGNVWSRAHIIPRSTAIDLMVQAIEAGEGAGCEPACQSWRQPPDAAAPVKESRSEFERGVRAACEYIASGVKGAALSRVEACGVMFLGEMTNEEAEAAYDEQADAKPFTKEEIEQYVKVAVSGKPDPYAHLPHGGEWFTSMGWLWHFPEKNKNNGTCYKNSEVCGEPYVPVQGGCEYPTEQHGGRFISRAEAIAIIEQHKAKQEQPAITSSLADIKAGRVRDAKDAFAELDAEIQEQPAPAMRPHDDKVKGWLAANHPEYEVAGYGAASMGDIVIARSSQDDTSKWFLRRHNGKRSLPRYILARKAKDEPVKVDRQNINLICDSLGRVLAEHVNRLLAEMREVRE